MKTPCKWPFSSGFFCVFCAIFCTVQLFAQSGSERSTPSLDAMLGQMIFVGIGEVQQIEDDPYLLREVASQKVGGVILFRKNLGSEHTIDRLQHLIGRLQSASPVLLWVGIDEEGGAVNRLLPRYGFFSMVSAHDMGQQSPDFTRGQAQKMARQLHTLGINLNFAPVVDVAINPQNSVIVQRGRSFGRDPAIVSSHAAAFLSAHREMGVCAVVKHFPGHGSSFKDTHQGVVDVTDTWEQSELSPYETLQERGLLDAVMTAHIVHRGLDESGHPATLSSAMVGGILRERLGFSGMIFSDDMQMMAIQEQYGMEEAVTLAVLAGVDILLFANNTVANQHIRAGEVHAMLRRLVETNKIPRPTIFAIYQRIMHAKRKYIKR